MTSATKPHALYAAAEEWSLAGYPVALLDKAGRPTTPALWGAADLRAALEADPDSPGVGVVTGGHDGNVAALAIDYASLPDKEQARIRRTLHQQRIIEMDGGAWLFPFLLDSTLKPWEVPPLPAPHAHNIEPVRVLRDGDVVPLPPSHLLGGPLAWRHLGGSNGVDFTLSRLRKLTIAVASLLGAKWTLGDRREGYVHPVRSWRCPS